MASSKVSAIPSRITIQALRSRDAITKRTIRIMENPEKFVFLQVIMPMREPVARKDK